MVSINSPLRHVSWIGVIPMALTFVAGAVIGALAFGEKGGPFGVAAVFAWIIGSRMLIFRPHRQGMALVRRKRFKEAIPYFRKSLEFFDRRSWIDRYRSIVMMSLSALSYREMAILNMAYCYSQMGDSAQARKQYEECRRRFPDCEQAIAAIQMVDSGHR